MKSVQWLISNLLLLKILTTEAIFVRLSCKQYGNFSVVHPGYVLQGSVIATFNFLSQQECKFECLMNIWCKSVNIENGGDERCELNNKTPEDIRDNTTLSVKPGWTFITTNYSDPLVGDNCKQNKPCRRNVLCKDTCVCPGYQCYPCEKGRTGLHCEGWKYCLSAFKAGHKNSGYFPIGSNPQLTFCNMSNIFEWILIQRNTMSSGYSFFHEPWLSYKNGFGTLSGDFWIGLDKLHQLTALEGHVRLRIEYTVHSDTSSSIQYETFTVGGENGFYKLGISGFSGSGTDLMSRHNGGEFFTNDKRRNKSGYSFYCAGWWFMKDCRYSLNSLFFFPFSHIEMKIQRK